MTIFFRLMNVDDKESALRASVKLDGSNEKIYAVDAKEFFNVPGAPFSYWTSSAVRKVFGIDRQLENDFRTAKQGLATADDFRFVRLSWEVECAEWANFAKGGQYSPYYSDIHLKINWNRDGGELDAFQGSVIRNRSYYLRPGLTWPRRTTSGLSMRLLPSGCIFADKGPAIFVKNDDEGSLLALQAIVSSTAFSYLLGLQLAAADAAARSYEVGLVQKTPIPALSEIDAHFLEERARTAWSLKRELDIVNETSHAFVLPFHLLSSKFGLDFSEILDNYNTQVEELDDYCFELYGFTHSDMGAAIDMQGSIKLKLDDFIPSEKSSVEDVLSWSVGVAFGRFDISLALKDNLATAITDPFTSLPLLSQGMRISDADEFVKHKGVLVSDDSEELNLSDIISEVLSKIDFETEVDIEKYIQKEFFDSHFKKYSMSRRNAPIYWPLQTPSGSYTLWVYYPSVNGQTLFNAVNDFVDPKIDFVVGELYKLNPRTQLQEAEIESLSLFLGELQSFREDLLAVAKFWTPNLSDGVNINAAPLYKLISHPKWRSILKKIWEELEEGDYLWSTMAYYLNKERAIRFCLEDRSVAIAHGIDADLWEEVEVPGVRGKSTKLVWQTKKMTEIELEAYIENKVAQG
ncbi:BREX-1 system adenine-specific DNA-methyltransferase PglX [Pseudomonadales bacterium]|nr:BREX-1 system adenine-specific DNA-methyltransferase PglX [Pseudomonadales bacterium]